MYIAEFNWGVLKADWEDPLVAEFVDNLDRVEAIADRFPGFIWRLPPEEMEHQQIGQNSPIDWADNVRVASTLSVWDSIDALKAYVYKGVHGQFFDKGGQWFNGVEGWPRLVLWNVDVNERPSVAEAVVRLKYLKENGPTDFAFDFSSANSYLLAKASGQEKDED